MPVDVVLGAVVVGAVVVVVVVVVVGGGGWVVQWSSSSSFCIQSIDVITVVDVEWLLLRLLLFTLLLLLLLLLLLVLVSLLLFVAHTVLVAVVAVTLVSVVALEGSCCVAPAVILAFTDDVVELFMVFGLSCFAMFCRTVRIYLRFVSITSYR